jgi:hypothetical protein
VGTVSWKIQDARDEALLRVLATDAIGRKSKTGSPIIGFPRLNEQNIWITGAFRVGRRDSPTWVKILGIDAVFGAREVRLLNVRTKQVEALRIESAGFCAAIEARPTDRLSLELRSGPGQPWQAGMRLVVPHTEQGEDPPVYRKAKGGIRNSRRSSFVTRAKLPTTVSLQLSGRTRGSFELKPGKQTFRITRNPDAPTDERRSGETRREALLRLITQFGIDQIPSVTVFADADGNEIGIGNVGTVSDSAAPSVRDFLEAVTRVEGIVSLLLEAGAVTFDF